MNFKEVVPNVAPVSNELNERSSLRTIHHVAPSDKMENNAHKKAISTSSANMCLSLQGDCSGKNNSVVSVFQKYAGLSLLGHTQHLDDVNDIRKSEFQRVTSSDEEKSQTWDKAKQADMRYQDESQVIAEPVLEGASSTKQEDITDVHMKCPWYDVHLAMQSRHGNLNESEIDVVMREYSYTELRNRLMHIQQQLTGHHELLDENEKSKAREAELEKEVNDLRAASEKDKKKAKKYFSRFKKVQQELKERENEIVQLKQNLANSKGMQDHQDSEVQGMSASRNRLEEENDNLHLINSLLFSKCQDNEMNPCSVGIPNQNGETNLFNLHQGEEIKTSLPPRGLMDRLTSMFGKVMPPEANEGQLYASSVRVLQQEDSFPVVSSKSLRNDDNKHNSSWDTQDIACSTRAKIIEENRLMQLRASWISSLGTELSTSTLMENERGG